MHVLVVSGSLLEVEVEIAMLPWHVAEIWEVSGIRSETRLAKFKLSGQCFVRSPLIGWTSSFVETAAEHLGSGATEEWQ